MSDNPSIFGSNDPQGSIWRKWDLHVHTKGTAKNDQFTSADFNDFCNVFFKKALESKISAIGVADYFSIENYKKVKEFVSKIDANTEFTEDDKKKIKQIFILPNVELRMLPVTDNGKLVNIHCIFNPTYENELENNFFNSVEYWAGIGRKYKMNNQGIISLGKSLDSSLSNEDEQYKKGVDNFVVTHESLQKLWDENSAFRENTIIVVSNSNNDGASGFQKHYDLFEEVESSSLDGIRKSIYCLSQIVFSGNPEDKKYFLGKKKDDEKTVKNKCGSLKPCIHGSDAHTEDKLFLPDQERFCWIKADLTFEGLKQVIYEPEDRVFIGKEPLVLDRVKSNKTKYIRSLIINNKTGKRAKRGKWFENVDLEFNTELVAIIGNKGSGKSAISDIIGLLGNTHNAGKDHANLSFLNNSKHKKFRQKGFAENFEAKLTWEDSTYIKKALDSDIDITEVEKVKYLPQNYFESLTNDLEEEGFEKTLKSVIFLHMPKASLHGKNTFEELEEYKSLSIQKDLPLLESDIETLSTEIISLEKRKHASNKSNIYNLLKEKEKELTEHGKNKPKEVNDPSKKTNSGADEKKQASLKKLENLNEELATNTSNISEKNTEKINLIAEKEDLQQLLDDLKRFEIQISDYKVKNKTRYEKYDLKIDEIIKANFNKTLLEKKLKAKDKLLNEVKSFLKTTEVISLEFSEDQNAINKAKKISFLVKEVDLKKQIFDIKKELSQPERDYQDYKEKLKKWNSLKAQIEGDKDHPRTTSKTVAFYKEEKRFIESDLPALLSQKRTERIDKSIKIFEKKKEVISLYENFKKSIDDEIQKDGEFRKKFKMDIDVSFKINKKFTTNFLDFINKGKRGTFYGKIDGEKYLSKIFEEKNLLKEDDIRGILKDIIEYLEYDQRDDNSEPREIVDQVEQIEEFYRFIFSLGYLEPNYELKLDDKVLDELSPGEKGALLLVFYLMIDKEDTPLIIDQPEDNLDNKSVFEVLTHFIRFAKRRRQIIIVTHNPNLAVGADAEQIIHVNLDKKKNYEFTCQSGAIENPTINAEVVDILEGTMPAFDKRKLKYNV